MDDFLELRELYDKFLGLLSDKDLDTFRATAKRYAAIQREEFARLTTGSTVTAAPVDSAAPNIDAGAAAGEL